VSADPWVTGGEPAGLNRHAYVRNNPLRFIDPSGYEPTQHDIDTCASNLTACFAWTYGISPNALVIVMGLGEGIDGGILGGVGDYWGYVQEFLSRYDPGCAGRVGECWDAVQMLMKEEGRDAVYDVFGIMFIESDPGGHIVQGASGIGTDRGRGALEKIIGGRRDKQLVGVIGVSLGAVTVADFFADNPELGVPFFLDSPPGDIATKACVPVTGWPCYTHKWVDYNEKAERHEAFAGKFGFWSGENCATPIPHCVNNSRAREVFDLLADKARELGR
jgi:hypothetical protein